MRASRSSPSASPTAPADWGGYSGYVADPDGYLWELAWGALDFDDGALVTT
ncbi:MAG: hypothetical protein ACRDWE_10750 [Acidimicrobiales bacterium]